MASRRGRTSSDDDNRETSPFNKRSKFLAVQSNKLSFPDSAQLNFAKPYEYRKMGLQLGKSPSLPNVSGNDFVDSISQTHDQTSMINISCKYTGSRKATNFPATHLKIGSWEYVGEFANDLVVKYFFSRQKLSWEMNFDGVKGKMDMTWSDIQDLQYDCPETGPGLLTIVLKRVPLFFIEIRPDSRKHTCTRWELTNDFTDGQASSLQKHSLMFSEGVLSKHLEFFTCLRQDTANVVESGENLACTNVPPSFPVEEEEQVQEANENLDVLRTGGEEQQLMKNNISENLMNDDAQPEIAIDEEALMNWINSI